MREIELKLQVPDAARAAVDAAVAGRGAAASSARRMRLQAAYVDTPDAALARAGLALRVRREGRRWVQTLKGAGADTLTRSEHEVLLPQAAGAAPPRADPALHRGTPAGDRLLALLGHDGAARLQVRYRTDVRRRTREVRRGAARIELAFDVGAIHGGDGDAGGAATADRADGKDRQDSGDRKSDPGAAAGTRWPLCELELELLAGPPAALTALAREWVRRHGLWVDARSKAERGELLARGLRIAPARGARPLALARGLDLRDAWTMVLRECVAQVVANASQIAAGEHGDEHVHQLRVGLRRLRSACRLFREVPGTPALGDAAAALFRALGAVRDRAVVADAFGGELRAAMQRAGLPDEWPPSAPPSTDGGAADACAIVRGEAAQSLLLDLIAAAADPQAAEPGTVPSPGASDDGAANALLAAPAARHLVRRVARWHRRIAADARGFAGLDDAGRHRLRKRAKRLRYALEFCAGLLDGDALRPVLKRLRALQDVLGVLNDANLAIGALRAQREADRDPARAPAVDAARCFALGWLAARRDALLERAAAAAKKFAATRRLRPARR
jgi:inorganic triphosphatase YgiF